MSSSKAQCTKLITKRNHCAVAHPQTGASPGIMHGITLNVPHKNTHATQFMVVSDGAGYCEMKSPQAGTLTPNFHETSLNYLDTDETSALEHCNIRGFIEATIVVGLNLSYHNIRPWKHCIEPP